MIELFSGRTRQHNELVRAKWASEPTKNEVLLWFAGCCLVRQEDDPLTRYRISIKSLEKAFNLKGNSYRDFKKTIKSIQSKGLEVDDKRNGTYQFFNFFSEPKYIVKEGVFEYGFTPTIHAMLKRRNSQKDSEFTIIELSEVVNYSSKFSPIMYPELKRILNQRQKSFSMTVDEFRLKFGILNKKSYARFNNINTHVLTPMKADMDSNGLLSFNYEKESQGNKVVGLKFTLIDNRETIRKKIIAKDNEISENLEALQFYNNAERLQNWGISRENTKDLLEGIDEDKVKFIIDEVNEMINNKKIELNQAAGVIVNKVRTEKIASKIEYKKGESQDLINKNRSFWEENSNRYHELMASTSYLQSNSGDVIKWNDDDFEDQLRPFLINED